MKPAAVGLCESCRHARRLESARGSTFWQCRKASRDSGLAKFPALPVLRCHEFASGSPAPDEAG
ncbi:MAG: hypothetical protein LJE84_04995 [Gammaproteobacteria bacterium]|nr:hypothetical protein [Gammaproteobacteria bacterium]